MHPHSKIVWQDKASSLLGRAISYLDSQTRASIPSASQNYDILRDPTGIVDPGLERVHCASRHGLLQPPPALANLGGCDYCGAVYGAV